MSEDETIPDIHFRILVAELADQGRTHVLLDMIEGMTGERPPEETFDPRKFPIRDTLWKTARKRLKKQRSRLHQRERQSPEAKAARLEALAAWKAANPDKMAEADKRRLAALKQERKTRLYVTVDLEGFDTGHYFTDDRRDYAREMHEGIARGDTTYEQACEHIKHLHVPEEEKYNPPFAGWTVHDHKWYLRQHNLTKDDPRPCARNKKPGTPDIYIEHRPFLFGAGNDEGRFFVAEEDAPGIGEEGSKRDPVEGANGPLDGAESPRGHNSGQEGSRTTERAQPRSGVRAPEEGGRRGHDNKKIPLSGWRILEAICDLPKRFGNAIFVTYAFGYDVSQILRCLDADTAGQLQAGEIVIKSIDEDGAPCEETIDQATFFWNEFAISYRRGKMFRVGRLKNPDEPYVYEEIKDPERRQAYIDAGREPVTRKIDYKDK